MKRWFILLGLCLISGISLSQSTNATISGGVADSSGNLIVDANVVIQNDATGVVYSAKTNSVGMYLVPILPPGHYHVQISKPGFRTIIKADVILNVQTALSLNFVLPVGATSESVTVDSASPPINTSNASVSTVVDHTFVENIPLNGRSFQDLISMTPGVVTQSPQTSGQVVGGSGDFSVNGQRTQSNYYTIDGVTANIGSGNGGGVAGPASGGTLSASTTLGTTQSLVSVDALQEFRVQSSTYSAMFGRSPGGQFSLATRSGTNFFHGTAFDYLRNNFFDANDWFNDYFGKPTPALRQNDFGGTVGGPIRFLRLYDGRNRSFFFASYEGLRLTQPTAAVIQYVPDTFMRQQATPVMQPILNAYPLPNGLDYGSPASPNLAQFIAPFSLPSTINATSVRVDQILGAKFAVFFRAGITTSSTDSRQNLTHTTNTSNTQTYTLGVNSQMTDTLSNEFRLGYARSDTSQVGALDSFGGATPIDLAAALGAGSYPSVEPAIYLLISGIGSSLFSPYLGHNQARQWNLVDTVSLSYRDHVFKFGFDYRHIKSPVSPAELEPYVIFESPQQILTNTPILPYVYSYLPSTPLFNQAALYAQDEWRILPTLHLSFGVRWELSPPPTEQHGNDAYTLQGSISNPASLSVAPRGTPLWQTTWYNFAPRLGAAWTLRKQPGRETVVRAGGGVFFDSANEVGSLGFSQLGFRAFQLRSGAQIPFTAAQLSVPVAATPPYSASVVIAFPAHWQLPYTLEWNTALQQALGKNQSFTISYVAANGRRLTGLQQLTVGKLNPNFGGIQYFAGGVTSNYQALQVQFQRAVAHGFQALGSYTWSHAIDFGSNSTALPLQRGSSDYDVRHNAQGGLTWGIPSLVSSPEFVSALIRDWSIDGRLNLRTAFPVTLGGNVITDPTTGSQYAGGLNLVPNAPVYLYGSKYPGGKAINKAAFTLPAAGAIGNAPRNFVRGFGETQLNLAVNRSFRLHDALVLRFRAETFNLLNHPNFGFVDATYTDATFGQATKMLNTSLGTLASQYQQGGARSMQFALKLTY
jgi:hypothetical protein